MLHVHLRVIDRITNQPLAVRLRVVDSSGRYCPPLGRLASFATEPGRGVGGQVRRGDLSWSYIDGSCEVPLSPGEVTIEVARGPEYTPLSQKVALAAGKLSLRLSLERWIDLTSEGWYAGDTRCHDLSPHAALLEGEAEGLAVVNLLARQHAGEISNILAFSGTQSALSSPRCHVTVNTLNSHPVLGTVSLLNSHRPVYPLISQEPENWSVADWCDQCHRKKGLVVWPDLPRLTLDQLQGEALAAAILGQIDAFEVSSWAPEAQGLDVYYRLLAAGLRPALVGGSGKDSNATPPGKMRTYAQLSPGEPLSPSGWIEAVRQRRTFITSGPLLRLLVNDQGPGSIVSVEQGQVVRIVAEHPGGTAEDRLQVIHSGQLIATASGRIETELAINTSGWIAAQVNAGTEQAHTTPIWVEVADAPVCASRAVLAALQAVLQRTLEWVRDATFEEERQREHIADVLRRGQDALTLRVRP